MGNSNSPGRGHTARGLVALLGVVALSLSSCAGVVAGAKDDAARLVEAYRERAERKQAVVEAQEPAPKTASVDELIEQGDQLRDAGELADALFAYVRAHRSGGDRLDPGERIAFLHLREDPERAESFFELLVERDPYSATLRTGLALAELAQGDLERARVELDEAIRLDPRAASPRVLIGVILDRLDQHEDAQEQYLAAHELRPNDWVILNNLGVSYLLADRPQPAERALRRAAQLEPRDLALRNNLGLALGLTGRYDEAFEQFSQAAGQAEAYNNLGWVFYLQGNYAEALRQFEQALDIEGDGVLTVLRNIELAQAALGDRPGPKIGFEAIPVEPETEEPSEFEETPETE